MEQIAIPFVKIIRSCEDQKNFCFNIPYNKKHSDFNLKELGEYFLKTFDVRIILSYSGKKSVTGTVEQENEKEKLMKVDITSTDIKFYSNIDLAVQCFGEIYDIIKDKISGDTILNDKDVYFNGTTNMDGISIAEQIQMLGQDFLKKNSLIPKEEEDYVLDLESVGIDPW